jgi:predicted esterase
LKTLPEAMPNFRWVFPSSGNCTASRFGVEMPQWFDIWSLENPEDGSETQAAGLKRSTARILALIELEARLVPHQHIFLAGLSQGCATAVYALLQLDQPLGGFIGLNSWLPFQCQFYDIIKAYSDASDQLKHIRATISNQESKNPSTTCLDAPTLLSHCKDDEIVLEAHGIALRDALLELGLQVEWHSYEAGGNWLNEPQGVDDLIGFIQKQHD